MLNVILVLWLVVYIINIIKCFYEYQELKKCVQLLVTYVAAYTQSCRTLGTAEDYEADLTTLLRYYPVIYKYQQHPKLAYSDSPQSTRDKSEALFHSLMMARNFKRHELYNSLIPTASLKILANIPSSALNWIGFKPKKYAARVLNIVGWAVAYFVNLFSEEIKELIILLFK